jgi:hypothetical protein
LHLINSIFNAFIVLLIAASALAYFFFRKRSRQKAAQAPVNTDAENTGDSVIVTLGSQHEGPTQTQASQLGGVTEGGGEFKQIQVLKS